MNATIWLWKCMRIAHLIFMLLNQIVSNNFAMVKSIWCKKKSPALKQTW